MIDTLAAHDDMPLAADMTRSLPGGVMDDSAYSDIETALDAAGVPCTKRERWLTLTERVRLLAAREAVAAMAMRGTCACHLEEKIDDGPDRPGEGPTTATMRRIRAEWLRQDIAAIRALPVVGT